MYVELDVTESKTEPQLVSSEHWGLPSEQLGMDALPFLGFRFLMFLEDGIIETDHMLPFVMLEQLKTCASET